MNNLKRVKKYKKKYIDLIFVFSVFIPFLMTLWFDVSGNIPFWYDNARDLASAWSNLSNPTLIGPPSGIQGIFYGPYWIWILSLGIVFSKDPRSAVFLVGILPYLVVFPLVLYLFKSVFKKTAIIVVWIFFIFNMGIGYAINLWNPHSAPLLLLLLVYLLINVNFKDISLKSLIKFFTAGVVAGLIINFHISLGFGIAFGLAIFFATKGLLFVRDKKLLTLYSRNLFVFVTGSAITFSPYFLFEARNGFNQTRIFYTAIFGVNDLVAMEGLSQGEILLLFLGRAGNLMGSSQFLTYLIVLISLAILIIAFFRKSIKFSEAEKNLILLLASLSSGVVGLYLVVRNPVWAYHFIGVEIIFLLFFTLVISKFRIILLISCLFASIIFITNFYTFYSKFTNSVFIGDSLNAKVETVESIVHDANGNEFSFYAYSPSIYVYEYSYIFKWLANKEIPFDPGIYQKDEDLMYLVVPKKRDEEVQDFINYRAGKENYKLINTWNVGDNVVVLKNEKNEK